ncbi:hypothetical protein V1227_16665 [Lentzea sp. DG1S-22]|uniref:hypothetical protein n=1 Tax=Lentzea sp. DG1S-22 TaxID=3108822 RepID=UPI002E770DA0|nr:hypothetical protein [Lentzea sp. DG1S-22]WVH84308.1 hypothetical protein V1227_16665 [Lentzea sp. DG1S-22]
MIATIFSIIGSFQLFNEPNILRSLAPNAISTYYTPNVYAHNLSFSGQQYNCSATVATVMGVITAIIAYVVQLRGSRKGVSTVVTTHSPLRPRKSRVLTAAMAVYLLYTLVPLAWLLISATKTQQDLLTTSGFEPGGNFALLDNITGTFTHDGGIFLRWLGNTHRIRSNYDHASQSGCVTTTVTYSCSRPTRSRALVLVNETLRPGVSHVRRCTGDRVFLPALQRRFVEEIDAVSARATTVVELPTSHSPFLSAPDDLAAAQILPVPAPWVTSVFTFAGVSRV